MKHLEIGDSILDDNEIRAITQHFPNLQTLCLLASPDYLESYELQVDSVTFYGAIISHCRKLKTLEFSLPDYEIPFDMEYGLFTEIPSLRKIVNDKRPFYREDYYNIADYVKRHRIPYEDIGTLKHIVEEYKLEDSDEY